MSGEWDMFEETRELHITPPPEPKQHSWYLLTGVVLGFILGLTYAWVINPVVYANTVPASLKENYKDTYRSTIAQVYAATGNLDRAQRRLALLEDADPVFMLGAQAQRLMAEDYAEEARALALLAFTLQSGGGDQIKPPDITPTITLTLVPTQTLPVNIPTP